MGLVGAAVAVEEMTTLISCNRSSFVQLRDSLVVALVVGSIRMVSSHTRDVERCIHRVCVVCGVVAPREDVCGR